MTRPDVNQSCPNSRHSGPVGCLPAPNIFPLAKETYAKGKMFWNNRNKVTSQRPFGPVCEQGLNHFKNVQAKISFSPNPVIV